MRQAPLLIAFAILLAGCADWWFDNDTCGEPTIHVTLNPNVSCLELTGSAAATAYFITGKNECSDTLSVVSDDGGTLTFAPGAEVFIELDSGTTAGHAAPGTWLFSATLGTRSVTIAAMATRAPC